MEKKDGTRTSDSKQQWTRAGCGAAQNVQRLSIARRLIED